MSVHTSVSQTCNLMSVHMGHLVSAYSPSQCCSQPSLDRCQTVRESERERGERNGNHAHLRAGVYLKHKACKHRQKLLQGTTLDLNIGYKLVK